MKVASHILAKIIEGCIWLVSKFGINALLIIILVVEIPVVYLASESIGSGYRSARNYKIQKVDVRPADEEAVKLNCPDLEDEYDEDSHYYLVTAYLTNFYGEEMPYALLHAQNQDGKYLDFDDIRYYDEQIVEHYNISNSEVIPAGVTKPFHYILRLNDYDAECTSEVILKEIGENDAAIAFSLPH